jgi:hypothetical protein
MIAYKFLAEGRVAPFSRVRWPEPGKWLESRAVEPCRAGVHGCRIEHLPYWLRPELWRIELGGEVTESELMLVAQRGRLVERIEAWDEEVAGAFGRACAAEARRRVQASPEQEGFADDAEEAATGAPSVAAFISARLAELQEGPEGYEAERARQASWLAERLGL